MTSQFKLPKPWVIAVATVVVLVAIFAVTCVWPWVETQRLHREIASHLDSFVETEDVLPEWIVESVQDRWPNFTKYSPQRILGVTLDGLWCDDRLLARVASKGSLISVDLCHTSITNKGLSALASSARLVELSISFMGISDNDLTCLRSLPNLRELTLCRTEVTGSCLQDLPGSRLEVVDIEKCPVSPAGMRAARSLPHLKRLIFRRIDVSAEGLAPLNGVSTLREFVLDRCLLVQMEAVEIPPWKGLRHFSLEFSEGPPAAFENLLRLQAVPSVNLTGTGLRDSILPVLALSPALEVVDLTTTHVSPEAVRELIENSNVLWRVVLCKPEEFARDCLPRNRVAEIVKVGRGEYDVSIEPRKTE